MRPWSTGSQRISGASSRSRREGGDGPALVLEHGEARHGERLVLAGPVLTRGPHDVPGADDARTRVTYSSGVWRYRPWVVRVL